MWVGLVDRVVVLGRDGAVVADGAPVEVLDRAHDVLRASGVWLPGDTPARRGASVLPSPAALSAHDLAIGRPVSGAAARPSWPRGSSSPSTPRGPRPCWDPTARGSRPRAHAGRSPAAGRGAVTASESLRAGAGPEPIRWTSAQLAGRIAMVFQEPEHQFLTARVRAELALGARDETERHRAEELLERLGLAHLADANPFTLSGGEKRRLAVASALTRSPSVLVLDEPTFGQDRLTWEVLVDLLAEQRDAGTAVLAVTHDEALVAALADSVVTLGAREVVSG